MTHCMALCMTRGTSRCSCGCWHPGSVWGGRPHFAATPAVTRSAKTGSSEGGPAKVRSGAGRGGRGARSSRGQKGASQEADVDAQPVDAQQQHAPPGIQPPAGAHQAESAEPSSEAPLPPVSMPSFFAAAGVFGAEEEDYDA